MHPKSLRTSRKAQLLPVGRAVAPYSFYFIFGVVSLSLSAGGCNSPKSDYERVLLRMFNEFDHMSEVLEGITSEPQASAALPRIREVTSRYEKLQKELHDLGRISQGEKDRLHSKYFSDYNQKSISRLCAAFRNAKTSDAMNEKVRDAMGPMSKGRVFDEASFRTDFFNDFGS